MLVRLHTRPLGAVEMDLVGRRLCAEDYAQRDLAARWARRFALTCVRTVTRAERPLRPGGLPSASDSKVRTRT